MPEQRPLCPYCGAHNGHPDGVEMTIMKQTRVLTGIELQKECPVCHSSTPAIIVDKFLNTEEKIKTANSMASHRFQPMQRPLSYDQAFKVTHGMTVYPPMIFIEFRDAPWKSGFMNGENYMHLVFGDIVGTNAKHGKKYWRPWLTRPTDEECAAAKWEEEAE